MHGLAGTDLWKLLVGRKYRLVVRGAPTSCPEVSANDRFRASSRHLFLQRLPQGGEACGCSGMLLRSPLRSALFLLLK
jgi:hypothetical protein